MTPLLVTVGLMIFAVMQAYYWFRRSRSETRAADLLNRLGGLAADVEVSLLRNDQDGDTLNQLIKEKLLEAGEEPDVSSFYAKAALFGVMGALLGLVLGGGLGSALLVAPVGMLVPYFQLVQKRRARMAAIERGMPEALQVIIISLRAGHPLPKSIETTSLEVKGPIAAELRLLSDELKLGRSVEEAFLNMGQRLSAVSTVRTFVVAVVVLQQTGGNLVEVLSQLVDALHEQAQYARKLAAMTAESRMSANILGGLPPAFLRLLLVIAPNYVAVLFDTGGGLVVLAIALSFYAMGILWLNALLKSGDA